MTHGPLDLSIYILLALISKAATKVTGRFPSLRGTPGLHIAAFQEERTFRVYAEGCKSSEATPI
jgi:hypothetical protein